MTVGLKHDESKTRTAELLFDFPVLVQNLPQPHVAALWQACRAARGQGDSALLSRAAFAIGGASTALIVGQIGQFGLEKYGTLGGWRLVENGIARYSNAAARHALAHLAGERLDDQSRLPHEYHLIWNLLAVAELLTPEE